MFQWWLGAGMYYGKLHLLTVEFDFEITVWSKISLIILLFFISLFPWLWTDCISKFFNLDMSDCQHSISFMLVEFIDCQSNNAVSINATSWPLAARAHCFCVQVGLAVPVWSLRLFSENELPQQAGGVSFPPGPLFKTVRWILNTCETWLEQKQMLLCISRVWGQL